MKMNTKVRWFSAGSLLAVFAAISTTSALAAEAYVYQNQANQLPYQVINGGASNVSGDTITRIVADDLTPAPGFGGQTVSNFIFAIVNNDPSVSISVRPRFRFWYANGTNGGPGTLITGFSAVAPYPTVAANTIQAVGFNLGTAGFTVPTNTFWAGITFDDNSGATGITLAQLNNLGLAMFDPPTVGTSADVYFESTTNGAFLFNNPVGALYNFGGSPKANFYFGMSAAVHIAATWQSVTAQENKALAITLAAVDSDGDPLTYAVVASPTNGTLTGIAPNLVYHPNTNYVGTDRFTFKASDASTSSAPGVVSITVAQGSAGLIINPIWDVTILNDPNVTPITNAINAAILSLESRFSDQVTVNILFAEMGSGLGQSSTYIGSTTYSAYFNALVADTKTTNDTVALAHLTGGANNPVNGGANIVLPLAGFRALGFTANSPTNYDSIISINTLGINTSRPPLDPNAYDLQAVATHEMDEVLGTSSGVGQANIHPPDLFRYTAAGARTWTTAGDDAYFSINTTSNLVQYNQDPGGDYGDWWSVSGSPLPRVQDAFATPGSAPDLAEELTVLDVVGWDLVAAIAQKVTAPAAVVHASKSGNTLNLSWSSVTNRNYQVQMRTNLAAGAWANLGSPILAATTTTTYSDTPLSDKTRFYRVVSLPSNPPSPPPPAAGAAGQSITGPFTLATHVLNPRPGAASAPTKENFIPRGRLKLAPPVVLQAVRDDN